MIEEEVEYLGTSMSFLFDWGDRVRYVRAAPAELALGDLVVFLFTSRLEAPPASSGGAPEARDLAVGLGLHRLVWKSSSGGVWRLWTKGDSRPGLDPEMPTSALIGKVVALKRGARPWRSALDARGRLEHLGIGAASTIVFGSLFCAHRAIVELSIRLSRRPAPSLRGARRAILKTMILLETLLPGDWGFRVLIATAPGAVGGGPHG